MFDRGLKTLVITIALAPSLLIALVLGTYLSISRLQDIDELVQERGIAATIQLAAAARPLLNANNNNASRAQQTLQELAELALEERGVRAVSVIDANGRTLAHAGPHLQSQGAARSGLSAQYSFGSIEQFIQPILPRTQYTTGINTDATSSSGLDSETALSGRSPTAPLGWIALDYSRQYSLLSRYRSLLVGALIISLAVIAAIILTVYASRRFSTAIKKLREGIGRIEQGTYDHPVSIDNDTSMQELADALNQMSAHIHSAQIDLQRSLEQTNRDLRESLDTVEIQNIELDLARREAIGASRIKSEFLANTSHELRTPLNGIIGFTKLLLRSTLESRQRDYLETIRNSAESLLAIINDILDFSKIEAGKLVIDNMPFSLRDLIEDTLAILAPNALEKNLQLTMDCDSAAPMDLVGDPLRLRQILLNLIGNAIKFTPTGSVHVGVRLAAPLTADHVALHIDVTDTGIGLNAQQLGNIFKPFGQADASTSRLFGGTGLGLVISKKLIEQMGGEITATSQPGQGSTFRLSLQLQTLSKTTSHTLHNAKIAPISPALRVLGVDDNPTNLRLLALLLEELGIEPQLADGGAEALTLLQSQPFDLALIDIQMPEIDGRAVVQTVRGTNNPNRHSRLIALTAHVLPEEQHEFLRLGFDECLTKPITEEHLRTLLAQTPTNTAVQPLPAAQTAPRPVDLMLCMQRARNKKDLARDMLHGVIEMLPEVRALVANDMTPAAELLRTIHKLHGACCYTGTPKLQQCSLNIEEQLKRNMRSEDKAHNDPARNSAFAELLQAMDELLAWREEHDLDVLFEVETDHS